MRIAYLCELFQQRFRYSHRFQAGKSSARSKWSLASNSLIGWRCPTLKALLREGYYHRACTGAVVGDRKDRKKPLNLRLDAPLTFPWFWFRFFIVKVKEGLEKIQKGGTFNKVKYEWFNIGFIRCYTKLQIARWIVNEFHFKPVKNCNNYFVKETICFVALFLAKMRPDPSPQKGGLTFSFVIQLSFP